MKEACLRPKEEPAACLQRGADRQDDPLQSVVGLSDPVSKAGLVRWTVRQLRPREEEQATCLRRQVERRDDPLQSAVGLSGPVPKAGLVRWAVKQLYPRPKEEPAACLQRGADRQDALAAGRACALAAASALAVWSQTAFAAVEPLVGQSATYLARVTERASRDASRPMAVGRQPPPALRRVPMRSAGQRDEQPRGVEQQWAEKRGAAAPTARAFAGAEPRAASAGFRRVSSRALSPGPARSPTGQRLWPRRLRVSRS